mgnify:CR=1 FL=1
MLACAMAIVLSVLSQSQHTVVEYRYSPVNSPVSVGGGRQGGGRQGLKIKAYQKCLRRRRALFFNDESALWMCVILHMSQIKLSVVVSRKLAPLQSDSSLAVKQSMRATRHDLPFRSKSP